MPPHSLLCPDRMIAGITQDSGTKLYQTATILYAHVRVCPHLFSMSEIYSGRRVCSAKSPEDDVTNDSPTILYIDDESDQRLVLAATLLEYRGFRVRIARLALDALELMVTERFNAVIRFWTILSKPSPAYWSCRQADDLINPLINPLKLDRQRGAI
jgi:hypothetical protein